MGPKDSQETLALKVLPAREVLPDLLVLLVHLAQLVLVVLLEQWGHRVEQEGRDLLGQQDRPELRE